ncbi:FAD-dependent oxidoreductase [Kribbella sp. NPDC051718]|uniref:FAD-dependent oxidoreductase n=1 Tax=Kribbella sp. NPDC051718 TaxID=3155168 RepID=UPI00341FA250
MSPYLRSAEGDPAEPQRGEPITITIDGQPVKALPGQSVAAALMADGRDSWRRTRGGGRARGVFCGIGACFDCLVVVNGLPDVRACQRTVRPADEITTHQGAVLPSPGAPRGDFVLDVSVLEEARRSGGAQGALGNGVQVAPVVVVGAGPAGMSAAVAAADAGSAVLLVDAGASAGGQFNRQLPAEFGARRPEKLQHGWATFARLRDRISADPQITQLTDTTVWSLERGEGRTRLWLQTGAADSAGRRVSAVETPALVLATGAYDRVLPFPGWDLPGVYTAGAAQALAKGQRISVGKRVVVAGTGPFLLPVAESLLGVGAGVVALLEANKPSTIARGWLTDPSAAASKLAEGLGYAALLARHRIRLRHGRTVIAAHGTDRVEAVTTARLNADWTPIPGTEERIEVDAVCLGFGFTPNLELAFSARCQLIDGPAVLVDESQQTSTPGVWAAGELTGIGGAQLAVAEGRVAGAAAAGSQMDGRAVAKGKRFARALDAAYPVRDGWLKWSGGDTVVCRCEGVSRGDLEETVEERDVGGARSLKLTSRAGLGMCQGRVCGRNVAGITGVKDGYGRPIAQPVRLVDLASAEQLEDL